jgi:protein SCO1/2
MWDNAVLSARRCTLVFVAVLSLLALSAHPVQASRWGKAYLPNANVVTQDGKTLRFYDDLIKEKVFVISFIYTSCRDICPLATSRLAELQEKLGDSMGRDVHFYSISIDPENDTPSRLKQYADTFGAGPGWLFLTGNLSDIQAIRHKLGDRSMILSEHRNEILLGNGATGEWARNNVLGDLDSLAVAVRRMDPNWRPHAGVVSTGPKVLTFDLSAQPGQALYKRLCAGCHTVGKGDRVGPDLAGVIGRRDSAWLTSFISDPEKMRSQGDPIAIALTAKYPNVRMPALGISKADAADLLSYVARLETEPAKRLNPLESLFALTSHKGLRLAPEVVQSQPVAVFFGFTRCPDVCPTTLLDWSNALEGLGADGDRLKVMFVSVDSERDTPETLQAYMASFDPRILALTGGTADIARAARAFDAYYERVASAGGSFTFDHSTKVYLVDRDGRLSGSVDLNTPENDRRRKLAELLAHH